MIITVTLNAAVDKTYTVENYTIDRVHRPSAERSVAGGKGINVARVLNTLGQSVVATGFIGGYNGGLITTSLRSEGIDYDFVETKGESRICIAVVDPEKRTQTEVNENGPQIELHEVEAMHAKIESLLKRGASHLILSGSAPPGVPSNFYSRAIRSAKAAGVLTVLDSSGEHLKEGIAAAPYMLKPNVSELSAYVERELYTVEEIFEAAREFSKLGVKIVVVSMGRAGALATDGTNAWQTTPPEIEFASAVGSGDSLVAAFINAIISGQDIPNALIAGTAAGAANAMIYGAGFCTAESIEMLKPQVVITQIA